MERKPRMQPATVKVLETLCADVTGKHFGLDICRAAGVPTGTGYPILLRLESFGWLTSEWESPEIHEAERRPRRRYYKLTSEGVVAARQALAEVRAVAAVKDKKVPLGSRLLPEGPR
jgi:PadR family transcriptional regulator PadR